jgi:muconolactone delta-isomerase
MDMSFHQSSSRNPAPDAIVDLIERREDANARRLIQIAPPVVQAEGIRELLWRGDAPGTSLAKELLDLVRLPHEELRSVLSLYPGYRTSEQKIEPKRSVKNDRGMNS